MFDLQRAADLVGLAILVFGVLLVLVVAISLYSRWLVKVPPNVAAVITGQRATALCRAVPPSWSRCWNASTC